jgi:hypothetical protein
MNFINQLLTVFLKWSRKKFFQPMIPLTITSNNYNNDRLFHQTEITSAPHSTHIACFHLSILNLIENINNQNGNLKKSLQLTY